MEIFIGLIILGLFVYLLPWIIAGLATILAMIGVLFISIVLLVRKLTRK